MSRPGMPRPLGPVSDQGDVLVDPPPAAKPRSRTRLIIQTAASLVPVVAIFYYPLKGIDLALV
jgi:hypothetical protein